MDAATLEQLQAEHGYKRENAGTPVTKIRARDVLDKTSPVFFPALRAERAARVKEVLGGVDPLAPIGDDDEIEEAAFDLNGRVVVVTGASRGIGEAIAVRLAGAGAHVALLAQTTKNDPALPGTIQDAAAACHEAGERVVAREFENRPLREGAPNVVAIKTDITSAEQVQNAIRAVVDRFGGIDVLINNASTHWPTKVIDTDLRRFDKMTNVNVKGSFIVTNSCLPFLNESPNPRVLFVAPAPIADAAWLKPHTVYSASKIAMGFLSSALAKECGDAEKPAAYKGVSSNTLWPRYAVATAAIQFIGGEKLTNLSRTPAAVADAAFRILSAPGSEFSNRHFIDDDVLRGMRAYDDVDVNAYYNVDPTVSEPVPDFFIVNEVSAPTYQPKERASRWRHKKIKEKTETTTEEEERAVVVLVLANADDAAARETIAKTAKTLLSDGCKVSMLLHTKHASLPTSFADAFNAHCAPETIWPLEPIPAVAAKMKKRLKTHAADFRDGKSLPKHVEAATKASYGLDAVVNLMGVGAAATPLRPTTSLTHCSGFDFDEIFHPTVRAPFLIVRECLTRLLQSDGPRAVLSFCPPPRAGSGDNLGAYGLARAVHGMHLVGTAAEYATADALYVYAMWAEGAEKPSEALSDAIATAAGRVVDAGGAASARPPDSGTFWRVRDVAGVDDVENVGGVDDDEVVDDVEYTPRSWKFPDCAERFQKLVKLFGGSTSGFYGHEIPMPPPMDDAHAATATSVLEGTGKQFKTDPKEVQRAFEKRFNITGAFK